ncbi:MAG: HEAT repeat domain-containing protein [Lentisphaeria bacterium]
MPQASLRTGSRRRLAVIRAMTALAAGALLFCLLDAGCRDEASPAAPQGHGRRSPPPAASGKTMSGQAGAPAGAAAPAAAADPVAGLLAAIQPGNDPEAAEQALRRLAATGDRHLATLAGWLDRADPATAHWAARALAAIGTPQALATLFDHLATLPADSPAAWELAAILADQTPATASRELLLERILDPAATEPVRDAAQRALAREADAALLEELVRHYDAAKDDATRQALTDTLRHAQDPELTGELTRLALERTTAPDTLARALWDTLGVIGTPDAVAALTAVSGASLSPEARQQLCEALARVDNPDARPLLETLAGGTMSGTAADLRDAAAQALANLAEK